MTAEWQQLLDRSQHATVEGVETHYFDEGDGHPILFLHGTGTFSCAELNWGPVIDRLADRFRVVAPDQPGFGFTPTRDDRDVQPRARADFVAALADQLGLESATVVGNSRGGFQALYLAVDRPDLVERTVVVNAASASRKLASNEVPGDLSLPEPTRERARKAYDGIRESMLVTPEHHPFFRGEATDAKVDRLYDLMERTWEFTHQRNDVVHASPESLNDALSYEGRHVTEFAADVEQPTLVTWSTRPFVGWPRTEGEPDDDPPPRIVEIRPDNIPSYERDEGFDAGVRLFETLPDAELHVWQDAKHHLMTDCAPEWAEVVATFVAD